MQKNTKGLKGNSMTNETGYLEETDARVQGRGSKSFTMGLELHNASKLIQTGGDTCVLIGK